MTRQVVKIFSACALLIASLPLEACGSGGDPSSGSQISGVLVAPGNGNGGSSNPNATDIAAAAVASAGFFVATGEGCEGCGSPSEGQYALTFAPPSLVPLSLASTIGSGDGSGVDMAVSGDGSLYIVLPAQAATPANGTQSGMTVMMANAASATKSPLSAWATFPLMNPSTSPGSGMQSYSNYVVVGSVAQADTLYASVVLIANVNSGVSVPVSPDSPAWVQGGSSSGGGSPPTPAHLPSQGLVFAVSCSSPPCTGDVAPAAVSTTFDPAVAIHTLVATDSSVCWLDGSSRVLCVPTGWAGATPPAPKVVAAPTLPTGWSLVAVAAAGSNLVWAAAPDVAEGAAGCQVWLSVAGGTPAEVYDGTDASFFCRGLATDSKYAYVTMNEVVGFDQGSSCNTCANGFAITGVIGTGIVRVPLGGGAPQTIPMQSQNWFGPRRVLVDDAYVYAIDPSYVVRAPLSAFAP